METRTFKKTGERVSLLGFGCMRLPILDDDPAKIDVTKATEMVDYAYAHGVNYFDTAFMYHGNKSEAFIGEALKKYPRESFNLATKLPPWIVKSDADIHSVFDKQLSRCQVDYFDYYLIHNISADKIPGIREHKIIEALVKKQEQGLIRNLGFSFHDRPECMEVMVKEHTWDFAQIQLNYMDWELQDAKRIYEILTESQVPVVVMEPVRGGTLATLSEKAVTILKTANTTASVASWALRFVATLPNVLTVLSGMSDMEQVKDNIRTMDNFVPISVAEQEIIDQALAAYRESGAVPCTACRYCMDCPAGVDIPKVFAIYNNYCTNKNSMTFIHHLTVLGEDKQPKHCVQCGACLEQCPQQLTIPQLMQTIAQEVEAHQQAVPPSMGGKSS